MTIGERWIQAARVVSALSRFDLATVLWAVQNPNRTRILDELLRGPRTVDQILMQVDIFDVTTYRALKVLMGAGLVVTRRKTKGDYGPRARVYEIA